MANRGPIGIRIDRNRSYFTGRDVEREASRHMTRGMFQFGGFVRKTAQNSMRKAGKNERGKAHRSKPGKPPRRHEGHLRDLMRFQVDRDAPSVIIGPAGRSSVKPMRGTPRRLEEGGHTTTPLIIIDETGRTYIAEEAPPIARPIYTWSFRHAPEVRVTVEKRPYMEPAFRVGQSNIERFFAMRV